MYEFVSHKKSPEIITSCSVDLGDMVKDIDTDLEKLRTLLDTTLESDMSSDDLRLHFRKPTKEEEADRTRGMFIPAHITEDGIPSIDILIYPASPFDPEISLSSSGLFFRFEDSDVLPNEEENISDREYNLERLTVHEMGHYKDFVDNTEEFFGDLKEIEDKHRSAKKTYKAKLLGAATLMYSGLGSLMYSSLDESKDTSNIGLLVGGALLCFSSLKLFHNLLKQDHPLPEQTQEDYESSRMELVANNYTRENYPYGQNRWFKIEPKDNINLCLMIELSPKS